MKKAGDNAEPPLEPDPAKELADLRAKLERYQDRFVWALLGALGLLAFMNLAKLSLDLSGIECK